MRADRLHVAAAVLVVLLVGAAAAFAVGGGGPFGADDGATDGETNGSDDQPRSATSTAGPPPFTLRIDRITECGRTCRNVTSTLRNEQSTAATDVGVNVSIYAGQGTDGSAVWSGYERVGNLEAGGTHTATQRVELSLREGLAVERADGWITIETTVEYDDDTVTFYRQRQVG